MKADIELTMLEWNEAKAAYDLARQNYQEKTRALYRIVEELTVVEAYQLGLISFRFPVAADFRRYLRNLGK